MQSAETLLDISFGPTVWSRRRSLESGVTGNCQAPFGKRATERTRTAGTLSASDFTRLAGAGNGTRTGHRASPRPKQPPRHGLRRTALRSSLVT